MRHPHNLADDFSARLASAPSGTGGGGSPLSLAELWLELCKGTVRVAGSDMSTAEGHHLIIQRGSRASQPPNETDVATLRALLLGAPRLLVAIDRARAQSSISNAARRGLSAFGVQPPIAVLTPLVLVVAAHAGEGTTKLTQGLERSVVSAGKELSVVTIPRFDRALDERLSPAVCAVVRQVLDGRTSLEIAHQRRVSVSTVKRQFVRARKTYVARDRLGLASKLLALLS